VAARRALLATALGTAALWLRRALAAARGFCISSAPRQARQANCRHRLFSPPAGAPSPHRTCHRARCCAAASTAPPCGSPAKEALLSGPQVGMALVRCGGPPSGVLYISCTERYLLRLICSLWCSPCDAQLMLHARRKKKKENEAFAAA